MRVLARAGHGHGGIPLTISDFVSVRDGHLVYHLIPLLLLTAVVLAGLAFLWVVFFASDYSTITIPSGCLTVVAIILLVIAIACIVLTQFPTFVWL